MDCYLASKCNEVDLHGVVGDIAPLQSVFLVFVVKCPGTPFEALWPSHCRAESNHFFLSSLGHLDLTVETGPGKKPSQPQ